MIRYLFLLFVGCLSLPSFALASDFKIGAGPNDLNWSAVSGAPRSYHLGVDYPQSDLSWDSIPTNDNTALVAVCYTDLNGENPNQTQFSVTQGDVSPNYWTILLVDQWAQGALIDFNFFNNGEAGIDCNNFSVSPLGSISIRALPQSSFLAPVGYLSSLLLDFGQILFFVLSSILTAIAAHYGLGWAIRKFRRYVSGGSGFTADFGRRQRAKNELYAAQIHNSALLEMGDKVQTQDTLNNLDKF